MQTARQRLPLGTGERATQFVCRSAGRPPSKVSVSSWAEGSRRCGSSRISRSSAYIILLAKWGLGLRDFPFFALSSGAASGAVDLVDNDDDALEAGTGGRRDARWLIPSGRILGSSSRSSSEPRERLAKLSRFRDESTRWARF